MKLDRVGSSGGGIGIVVTCVVGGRRVLLVLLVRSRRIGGAGAASVLVVHGSTVGILTSLVLAGLVGTRGPADIGFGIDPIGDNGTVGVVAAEERVADMAVAAKVSLLAAATGSAPVEA